MGKGGVLLQFQYTNNSQMWLYSVQLFGQASP